MVQPSKLVALGAILISVAAPIAAQTPPPQIPQASPSSSAGPTDMDCSSSGDYRVWLASFQSYPDQRRYYYEEGDPRYGRGAGYAVCESVARAHDAEDATELDPVLVPTEVPVVRFPSPTPTGNIVRISGPQHGYPPQPLPQTTVVLRPAKEPRHHPTPRDTAPPISLTTAGTAEGYAIERIFFGTDRRRADNKRSAAVEDFSGERGAMQYGYADVSVPRTHRPGQIERPAPVIDFIFGADPKKHMTLLAVTPLSGAELEKYLQYVAGRSKTREGLVFIHGYNVAWKDAILRTAQLAWDLRIEGPSVSFSWPSVARADPVSYNTDNQAARASANDLASFLETLTTKSGVTRLHVIAHSMGSEALSSALAILALRGKTLPNVHDISLAAPDIDQAVFTGSYAESFRRTSRSLTIYESSRDAAMTASRKYNGAPRLGDANPLTLVPGFQVIDASTIDTDFLGHGYFATQLAMLTDFEELFIDVPLPRPPLVPRTLNQLIYYAFP